MKTECDYLYGWTKKKKATYAKISPKYGEPQRSSWECWRTRRRPCNTRHAAGEPQEYLFLNGWSDLIWESGEWPPASLSQGRHRTTGPPGQWCIYIDRLTVTEPPGQWCIYRQIDCNWATRAVVYIYIDRLTVTGPPGQWCIYQDRLTVTGPPGQWCIQRQVDFNWATRAVVYIYIDRLTVTGSPGQWCIQRQVDCNWATRTVVYIYIDRLTVTGPPGQWCIYI